MATVTDAEIGPPTLPLERLLLPVHEGRRAFLPWSAFKIWWGATWDRAHTIEGPRAKEPPPDRAPLPPSTRAGTRRGSPRAAQAQRKGGRLFRSFEFVGMAPEF